MTVDTPFLFVIKKSLVFLLYFNGCKSVQYGGNTKMRSEDDDCVTSKNWS